MATKSAGTSAVWYVVGLGALAWLQWRRSRISSSSSSMSSSSSSSSSSSRGAAAARRVHTVLCYGDSNTWGYDPVGGNGPASSRLRLPDGARWTCRLQAMLNGGGGGGGGGYRVIVDALNSRTTVHDDPAGPCDGEYSCNGRAALMPTLHAHKPLSVVVLALGTNDLKVQFGGTAHSIAAGVRILARDVLRATAIGRHPDDARGERLDGPPPALVILGVPGVRETAARPYFAGAARTCRALVPLLRGVAEGVGGEFVDLQALEGVAVSPLDGLHFEGDAQEPIAAAVAAAVREAVGKREAARF